MTVSKPKAALLPVAILLVASGCQSDGVVSPNIGAPRFVLFSPCTTGSFLQRTQCFADQYVNSSGDFFCEAYGARIQSALAASQVTTMPNAIPMSFGRALGKSGGGDPNIYSSESFDYSWEPQLNPRSTDEMANTVMHEAIHLEMGWTSESAVNAERNYCNSLVNLPQTPNY